MTNNNVEVSTENTIDWEARAKKAEAKIVDMKTSVPKEEEAPVEKIEEETFGKEQVEKLIAEALEVKQETAQYEANQRETESMGTGDESVRVETGFNKIGLSEYDSLSAKEQRVYMNDCIEKLGEFDFAD